MTRSPISLAAVQEVLWQEWDPIGVHHSAEARDEYETYALHILALLQKGVTLKELALHLLKLEKTSMGLPGKPERCEAVALRLIRLLDTAGE